MKRIPVFSLAGKIYFDTINKLRVWGSPLKSGYAYRKYPELTGVFGCEGDKDAPIAFIDGSYLLRDGKSRMITFGVPCPDGKINWYNKEGFLPCLVSEYSNNSVNYVIENFADKISLNGNDFEIAYSRLSVENKGNEAITFPKVSKHLIPLTKVPEKVKSGEKAIVDYAAAADRFGGDYPFPTNCEIKSSGGFDIHYDSMKKYWLDRLEPLAEITELPDKRLIDAYKAGYIYTMICKDENELHVGENGYDRVFDHDVIGILNTLILLGDFKDTEEYSEYILKNVQYPDARWKYSWFFASYLQKTGNVDFVNSKFEDISRNAHSIAESRIDGGKGIMKKTMAIDSPGHWTTDNFSALTGLICYAYICRKTGRQDEAEWAEKEYDDLLCQCDKKIRETVDKYGLDYLPMSMEIPNSETSRSDPRDANRLSMFLFGRWCWDAYLFGGKQYGPMVELIDATYEHSAEIREKECASFYNFGGYPHGYFCSAYNAGYGSAALRGDKYRDTGIKAYQYMIDNAQSGPFSWWEGIKYPDSKSIWSISHASGGGGSCPHMWGQSTATKVLFDSIICEKADGTLIIGRGIPKEWLKEGCRIQVRKYPVSGGKRVNLLIEVIEGKPKITVENFDESKIQSEL